MFRKSLSQARNIPTSEKGGLAGPEFDETTMIRTINVFFNSHLKLNEPERKIELKYNFLPEHGLLAF